MFRTAITAAVLVLTAATAHAQDAVTVRFSDINLADAGGMRALAERVQNAAEMSCGARTRSQGASDFFYLNEHQSCVHITSRDAMARIENRASHSVNVATK
jgi:UrcA family protein